MSLSTHQIHDTQRITKSVPFDKAPTATSRVQYDDDTERSNDDLRHVFNDHMEEAHYKTSSFYKQVKCLLISWAEECDDLNTGPEVADLANVLENKMHFKVTRALLVNDVDHLAQIQVAKHIINFIYNEDGARTLLLFYYAGHGSPKSMRGGAPGLALSGKRLHSEDTEDLDDVVWAHIEDNFRHTKADVLEIFDCCYAGNLNDTRQGWGTRSFEFLGACSSGNQTMSPGKESFTSALIWALEALLKDQRRFTVAQLSRQIRLAPDFPRDQVPVQLDRCSNAIERIVLAPLAETNGNTKALLNDSNDTIDNQGHLTLNFVFDKSPSKSLIGDFAKALDSAMRRHQIPVKRIGWGGFQPPRNKAFHAAAKMFQESVNRKKRKREGDENEHVSSRGPLTPSSSTEQPSPG